MSKHRVLIIEDEAKLLAFLRFTMETEGFSVTACTSYSELEAILNSPSADVSFDMVILDRMLRQYDTIFSIEMLKRRFPSLKILILSAINTPAEKASSLDRGADDYLSKPFASEELVARVRALLRRGPTVLRFGNVVMDLSERSVTVGEAKVTFSNKEFTLLKTFLEHPGKIFTKASLTSSVWEMRAEIDSNAVEMTISNLRRKLDDNGAKVAIKNSRNVGYWVEE